MIERQEVISQYGDKAEDYIVNALGVAEYNHRTHKGLCPFHSEKTPSFSYNPKTHSFKCFGCGATVDIVSYYIEHENMSYIQAIETICDNEGIQHDIDKKDNSHIKRQDEQKYTRPSIETNELSEGMILQMKKRGIEKSTLDFWRVKAAEAYFKSGKQKGFAFPYYDEDNVLTNYSFRSKNKEFAQHPGCKSILWGMWHIDTTKQLIIVEGQIDAMSVWQSGIKNVVSIPAGANNRQYIENNFDFLSRFEEVIFWIDNDEPGRTAGQNLKSRLPNARIIHHTEFKDPNEVMLNLGVEEVIRFINQLPPLPNGIKLISDAQYDVKDADETNRIETGFHDFDRHVNDWRAQQLSVVFGRDNEGKSTFISQVVTHQLHKGVKTFLFSAELGEQSIQDWLYKQLIGDQKDCFIKQQGKYETFYSLRPEVLTAVRKYTKDKLYIIDESDEEIVMSNDVLFKRMAVLASKFGVKLFVMDNLQAILTSKFSDINRDQSYFMERCRQFAKKYRVHVIVVAHPHKVEELTASDDTTVGNLKKDSISGSKDISNKAHNIISIERDFSGEYFDMILTNLKDKHKGIRKGFKYNFSSQTKRFYNEDVPNQSKEDFTKWIKYDIGINDGERLRKNYESNR